MAALAGLIAHGGVAGAIVESLLVVAVGAVLLAVWVRERRAAKERVGQRSARLRDDDEAPLA